MAEGTPAGEGYLGVTTSACSDCARLLPARLHAVAGGVLLRKHCPDHGAQEALVCSDASYYFDAAAYHRAGAVPLRFETPYTEACPGSCGLCPQHEQHVCMPVLEITDHCDMDCPICLTENRSSGHLSRAQVGEILDRLVASEGQVDVLNLSGGEPTLNPEFRPIVEECLSRREVLRVSVSTNGLRLLQDDGLLAFLAERNVVVSLQFDGLEEGAYLALRGRPVLGQKLRLLDRLGELDAPTSLTCTVAAGANERGLGEVLGLLFGRGHVLSVMFQPAAYTGRASSLPPPARRVTIPDVLGALDGACGGRVHARDFSPLPCSHPACFSLAFYLRGEGGEFLPVKGLVPPERLACMIQNRGVFGTDEESFRHVREAVYDLWSGPSALAPDSQKALRAVRELLRSIECGGGYEPTRALRAAERSVKSVFIHQFMDRGTFDLARARKCCTVYPDARGRSIPACVRNCLGRR